MDVDVVLNRIFVTARERKLFCYYASGEIAKQRTIVLVVKHSTFLGSFLKLLSIHHSYPFPKELFITSLEILLRTYIYL